MDDGNRNSVYEGLPKGGASGKMQGGKGGVGSNNPKAYGPKPSFGTGKEGNAWKGEGGRGYGARGKK